MGLLSLVGVAFLVAQSPLLGAETVTVEGAGQTSVAQVRAAAKVEDGTPLLFLDTADVARRVESLPAVARAEVETELPNTVVVTVVERVPVAWIRTVGPSPIAVVDATGRVVRLAVAPPAGLPEVVGVGNVARLGTTVAKGVGFRGLAALPAALRGQPRTFTVSNGQASMTITGTPPTVGTVVFGPMTDMKRKGIAALAVIDDLVSRGQRVGELDVSVPDAPITRGPAPR